MTELKIKQLKKVLGGMNSGSPDLPVRQQTQQFSPPPTYSGGN